MRNIQSAFRKQPELVPLAFFNAFGLSLGVWVMARKSQDSDVSFRPGQLRRAMDQ